MGCVTRVLWSLLQGWSWLACHHPHVYGQTSQPRGAWRLIYEELAVRRRGAGGVRSAPSSTRTGCALTFHYSSGSHACHTMWASEAQREAEWQGHEGIGHIVAPRPARGAQQQELLSRPPCPCSGRAAGHPGPSGPQSPCHPIQSYAGVSSGATAAVASLGSRRSRSAAGMLVLVVFRVSVVRQQPEQLGATQVSLSQGEQAAISWGLG